MREGRARIGGGGEKRREEGEKKRKEREEGRKREYIICISHVVVMAMKLIMSS